LSAVVVMKKRQRIAADTPLRSCPERNVGLALCDPISDRLDRLVALAEGSFDRTSRKELLASLILAAPADGTALVEMLRAYRQSTAEQAGLDEGSTGAPLTVSDRRPGPRPRR
jgi:hypothetical protein